MPPFDKHSIEPMPIDEEADHLQMELERKSSIIENTPIRSCLRKEEFDFGKFDTTETKMKKSCHFHDSTSILWIEPIENMSLAEIDDCYYSTDDYTFFRNREKRIVRNFSNFGFMKKGRKDDYLGVESRLQRFHRRERTKNALFAVLLEQELRVECCPNTEDDAAIARSYKRHTNVSARLARERADKNASLVRSSSYSSWQQTKPFRNEIEMEIDTDAAQTATKESETPWEVPVSKNKKRSNKKTTTNLIRYSTCAYPIAPVDDTVVPYSNKQILSQPPPQEHLYLRQNQFEDGERFRDHKVLEAPAQQKNVQPQTHYKFNHAMVHPQLLQHYPTNGYTYPDPLNQRWVWNQVPRDEVSRSTLISNQRAMHYHVH